MTTIVRDWVFPNLLEAGEEVLTDTSSESMTSALEEQKREIQKERELLAQERQRLIDIEMELHERSSLIATLLKRIESAEKLFDQEMIEVLTRVIFNVVRKITHGRISRKPAVFLRLIDEAKMGLPRGEQLMSIEVSPDDMKHLPALPEELAVYCRSNPDLARGDVVIETAARRIVALLDDRIHYFLRSPDDHREAP